MANCSDYISADDLKTAKQAVSHITHVAKSKDGNGQHALSVTDNIGGDQVTNLTLDGMEAQFQTDQTERENEFEASQTDKEERFQQFLLSSGYQFLGDYEDGPYTITGLNQVIRYDGELWRLNAATNPPYTTTGTDSTSWATDVTHLVSVGDAALRQDLGSSEGFKYIGQVPSVSVLTGIPGSDGERVLVTGYYAGSNHGGGEFYYDSSVLSENNGVTVFNGWRRKFTTKTISTFDAGLNGDDTDATPGLQAIADFLSDSEGFVFNIYGYHQVTKNIWFKNSTSLIVDMTHGHISSREKRNSFSLIQEFKYGLLYFDNCNSLRVVNPNLTGAMIPSNPSVTIENGDGGIQLYQCSNVKISNGIIDGFWSYGILAEEGDDILAEQVTVRNIMMQSGINLWYGRNGSTDIRYGNKNCFALNNTLDNCRLYGIELENAAGRGPCTGAAVRGNKSSDCKWGVAVVGDIIDAVIEGNESKNCQTGICVARSEPSITNIPVMKNITGNMSTDNAVGLTIYDSSYVTANGNSGSFNLVPDKLNFNQYDIAMRVDADDLDSFYAPQRSSSFIPGGFYNGMVGRTIYINNVSYIVVASVLSNRYQYEGIDSIKVTLDKTLPSATTIPAGIMWSPYDGSNTNGIRIGVATETETKNISVTHNNYAGEFMGVGANLMANYPSSAGTRLVLDHNVFKGALSTWINISSSCYGKDVGKNNVALKSAGATVATLGANYLANLAENIMLYDGPWSGSGYRRVHMYARRKVRVIGIRWKIVDPVLSGNLYIGYDDNIDPYYYNGLPNTDGSFTTSFIPFSLAEGDHAFFIRGTNSLAYSSWQIELLCI